MSERESLLAAIAAAPDDDTLRHVYADWCEEYGVDDRDVATGEFIRACFARVTYRVEAEITDDDAKAVRRKNPGWREWLASDCKTWRCDGKPWNADQYPSLAYWPKRYAPDVMNWHRLLPRLWGMLQGKTRWARVGRKVKVWNNDHGTLVLDFQRGFLARVEFTRWWAADNMLAAILADQPLVQPGIIGQPYHANHNGIGWYVDSEPFGPLYDEIHSGPQRPAGGVMTREKAQKVIAEVMLARVAERGAAT